MKTYLTHIVTVRDLAPTTGAGSFDVAISGQGI